MKTAEGYQVGNADYVATKREALKIAESHSLPLKRTDAMPKLDDCLNRVDAMRVDASALCGRVDAYEEKRGANWESEMAKERARNNERLTAAAAKVGVVPVKGKPRKS